MDDTYDLHPREHTKTLNTIGIFRLPGDLDIKEIIFLLLAFLSMIVAGAITIVRIVKTSEGDPELTFSIIVLVNLIFVLYYVVHGVFCERPLELLVSVLATVILMLYCIVEYAVHGYKTEGKEIKMYRLIAVCALGPFDIILGCLISFHYFVANNLIFRTVGANASLQKMCQTMFIFTTTLKFDFQLVINLLILVLVGNVHEITSEEKLVIGLGTPFSILWLLLGFIMVRYELLRLSTAFWILSLAEPAYIIFLFVRTNKDLQKIDAIVNAENLLLYSVFVAGSIALIIRIALVATSVMVTRNFGKGLKEKVYGVIEDNEH